MRSYCDLRRSDPGPDYRTHLLELVWCSLQSEGGAFEIRKSQSVERVGKAYIGELEVKVDGRCNFLSGSLCRLEEGKAALLGRHCCLGRGSFSGLRQELSRHRHRRRRCDLVPEACWVVGKSNKCI